MLYKDSWILSMKSFRNVTRLKWRLITITPSKTLAAKRMFTYEDAIYALNGLQSNFSVLEKARKERDYNANKHITNTEKFLRRLEIMPEDLDRLNAIHVSGTKGKGSTCAFTECILRHQGLKTGFYSSPHLVVVRERIRINGKPLSKEAFTFYFWKVYNRLKECQVPCEETPMPSYFMFLTVMAFYVFLQEKVDVAVVEVGIGGLYDTTNVLRSPIAVGVTSLGFDHVRILGNTIEEIAFQKAGIFKSGVPAFTVSQLPKAIRVLQAKAAKSNCLFYVVPPLAAYDWENASAWLGIPGEIQTENASLALQLSQRWLSRMKTDGPQKILNVPFATCNEIEECDYLPPPLALPFTITSKFKEGLQNTIWSGRCQVLHRGPVTYFLDGAHTAESMENCIKWYRESSRRELSNKEVCRILLFNCTRDRKPESLLSPLIDQHFDLAIFCPNATYKTKDSSSDSSNFTVDPEVELRICEANMKVWNYLHNSIYEEGVSYNAINSSNVLSVASSRNAEAQTMIFSCLKDALQWVCSEKHEIELSTFSSHNLLPRSLVQGSHISVLVTGSLHLVGNVLSLTDPELQNT